MTLTLDLPQDLEGELSEQAARLGLPLAEYAVRVLQSGLQARPMPRTGAELVAYWEAEGLIGTRPDLVDSQQHARQLRDRCQARSAS